MSRVSSCPIQFFLALAYTYAHFPIAAIEVMSYVYGAFATVVGRMFDVETGDFDDGPRNKSKKRQRKDAKFGRGGKANNHRGQSSLL